MPSLLKLSITSDWISEPDDPAPDARPLSPLAPAAITTSGVP